MHQNRIINPPTRVQPLSQYRIGDYVCLERQAATVMRRSARVIEVSQFYCGVFCQFPKDTKPKFYPDSDLEPAPSSDDDDYITIKSKLK